MNRYDEYVVSHCLRVDLFFSVSLQFSFKDNSLSLFFFFSNSNFAPSLSTWFESDSALSNSRGAHWTSAQPIRMQHSLGHYPGM